jgi:hypothetical protein
MGKNSTRIRDEHPDHISESLETIVWGLKIFTFIDVDLDAGAGIFLTLDPG